MRNFEPVRGKSGARVSDGASELAQNVDYGVSGVQLFCDRRPEEQALRELWSNAWSSPGPSDWDSILSRSLCYICAYQGEQLVGFVNVAWDGGVHASIFDTTVHTAFQRRGIATQLLRTAMGEAASRGAHWLHVDFEPHLEALYHRCGFRPTEAGLVELRRLRV